MTVDNLQHIEQNFSHMQEQLANQQRAFLARPMPTAAERIRRLDKLHNALIDYRERLVEAVSHDFGGRSRAETLLAEFYATLEGIAYNRKHLTKWMKPEKRHASLTVFPARVEVMYQPIGVVGIVVPWNFPIFLCLSPLVGALAAGNRAMIKTSEFAPHTSVLLKEMLEKIFDTGEVAVVEGGVEVSTAFTQLPFDHLVFTGATNIGKLVMAAAAPNLTPVTLELGGKSPAVIHPDFPIEEAANRLAFGKSINAGQICVSPDYILCPRNHVEAFVDSYTRAVSQHYPTMVSNTDYTAIINDRQRDRLLSYLDDAEQQGATLLPINPKNENFEGTGKLPPTLVLHATENMRVMKEEIFGPILPIIPYDTVDGAIDFINEKPRPLALYYFDWDKKRSRTMLERTHSGGVCVNDTLSHVTSDDIPFGGVGPSGMGHYHGKEGFLNFSKAKGIVRKGKVNIAALVAPPWDRPIYNALMKMQAFRFRKRRL